jgi:hypothetical protein
MLQSRFSALSRTTGYPYPGTKLLLGRPRGANNLSIGDSTALAPSPEIGGAKSLIGFGKLFRRASSVLGFVITIYSHYIINLS